MQDKTMLGKNRTIELLDALIERGRAAQREQITDIRSWQLDAIALLARAFGDPSRQLQRFNDVRWTPEVLLLGYDETGPRHAAFRRGLDDAITCLKAARDEVEQFDHAEDGFDPASPLRRIENLCENFHRVAQQLRHRHDVNRPTLGITDEYDVQDLMHALLLLDFADIRHEEWAPSYAGASSRMDFLLKNERIVLEVKKSRKGLLAKEVGEQLLVDCQRYKAHPHCETLVCFVYDPEGLIANPRGLENDLAKAGGDLSVKVYIRP